jgi:hypothetical protein
MSLHVLHAKQRCGIAIHVVWKHSGGLSVDEAHERAPCMFMRVLSVRSQIIRASAGTFRRRTVSAQLIESVPVNTMANLTTAGNGGL